MGRQGRQGRMIEQISSLPLPNAQSPLALSVRAASPLGEAEGMPHNIRKRFTLLK